MKISRSLGVQLSDAQAKNFWAGKKYRSKGEEKGRKETMMRT